MTQKRKILIIGKTKENCINLKCALEKDYTVSIQKMEHAINCNFESIAAILLNLSFPYVEDLKVLENLRKYKLCMNIPIIILANCKELDIERKAYELGVTDFIKEPYDYYILKHKIANLIKSTQLTEKDDFLEKDILTNLYNKQIFFKKVNELIKNTNICYDIICFDIERFKLINDFFGTDMGDLVLKYIGEVLEKNALQHRGICTRLDSDIFATCIPRIDDAEHDFIIKIANSIKEFSLGFSFNIKFGIYKIEDPTVSIRAMCDRAKLAKQSIKGKYGAVCAYYDKSLREKLVEEQEIINDMSVGLVNGHFKVYYQPKYNLTTGGIIGAEALVRWVHPKKGIIVPYRFIPLFEKNGFITTLDIYIWENVCSYIRNRINKGQRVVPISVNVSRVDIYNPNLVDILQKLIEKYDISPALLELEITETAYTENPEQMIEIIQKLKSKGFKISMDDFGSGYSSLNMLSEIAVDIIKLDIKFLHNNDIDRKNGNILNFVVNLAKWMDVPVIAEGIETEEQVEYLKSIGCFNGQGYFFSRPLKEEQFTKLLEFSMISRSEQHQQGNVFKFMNTDDIWNPSSHFNTVFNNYIGALAMYEYTNGKLMFLRGNDEYYELTNWQKSFSGEVSYNILKFLYPEDRLQFIKTLDSLAILCNPVTSETRWIFKGEKITWLKQKIKVIYKHSGKTIFLCHLENITAKKEQEEKLVEQNNELIKLCDHTKKEMQSFKFAYSHVPCGIIKFSPRIKDNIISMNNESLKIFGYDHEEDFKNNCNGNLLKVIPTKERKNLIKTLINCFNNNCQEQFILKAIKKDTSFVWIKGYIIKEAYEGESGCCNFYFTDVTNELCKQRQLEILKEQYNIYKNHSNSIVLRYNKRKKNVTFIITDKENNPQMLPINNFPHRIMESGIILEEFKERVKTFFEQIQAGMAPEKIHIKVRDCIGEPSWYEISVYLSGWCKESEEVICIFKNITEEKNQELLLIQQAKRDELTGLFNRKALQVHLSNELPKIVENGGFLAFLMIDLDGFKEINDQYGHMSGDQALIAVSTIFSREIAHGDIVARIGGDEFAVVLESITCEQDAIDYGNKICSSIERYKKEFDFTLSCSVGISIAPHHGMEFQELYKKADKALYDAKRLGKNMCCLYEN